MSTTELARKTATQTSATPVGQEPATGGLDPTLTRQLDRTQMQLLELYSQSHLLLAAGDRAGAQHRLGSLLVRLRDHAHHKQATLYTALATRHAFDPFVTAVLRDGQELTAVVIENATHQYRNLGQATSNEDQADQLKAWLHGLGTDLTRCIELDAALLFPLYRMAVQTEQGVLAN